MIGRLATRCVRSCGPDRLEQEASILVLLHQCFESFVAEIDYVSEIELSQLRNNLLSDLGVLDALDVLKVLEVIKEICIRSEELTNHGVDVRVVHGLGLL